MRRRHGRDAGAPAGARGGWPRGAHRWQALSAHTPAGPKPPPPARARPGRRPTAGRGVGQLRYLPGVYVAVIPRHLYLHVPFCVRRCSYCDFAVTVAPHPPGRDWIEAVAAELARVARERELEPPWRLDTVYCGGGTPSLLGAEAMGWLRERLSALVYWEGSAEWTCEANPESFTPAVAAGWAAAGVNRISLGAQTFDGAALRWMGRRHGPAGPAAAGAAARSAGIANVSIDLIFGLPGRLERDWAADLRQAIELTPEHISLYGLTAEAATPLGRRVREGREELAGEAEYAAEYLVAVERLEMAGYVAYEVSNFARPGMESRHNQAYWDGRPYLGLGSGAHSFLPPERWWNVRDWPDYLARLQSGGEFVAGRERRDAEAAGLERLWLGLRQRAGLDAGELNAAQSALAAEWQAGGWARRVGSRIRLTPEGWLRLDALAVALASA
ncbi:MAG: radical SAM family heme chaperone HemW [Gemmatimonadetes bacterium]|nr:radical SAM family heme chaperone HemW [Gemmatimonadota bacterium]